MSKAGYTDHLRIIKSLLIVTSLQKEKILKPSMQSGNFETTLMETPQRIYD